MPAGFLFRSQATSALTNIRNSPPASAQTGAFPSAKSEASGRAKAEAVGEKKRRLRQCKSRWRLLIKISFLLNSSTNGQGSEA